RIVLMQHHGPAAAREFEAAVPVGHGAERRGVGMVRNRTGGKIFHGAARFRKAGIVADDHFKIPVAFLGGETGERFGEQGRPAKGRNAESDERGGTHCRAAEAPRWRKRMAKADNETGMRFSVAQPAKEALALCRGQCNSTRPPAFFSGPLIIRRADSASNAGQSVPARRRRKPRRGIATNAVYATMDKAPSGKPPRRRAPTGRHGARGASSVAFENKARRRRWWVGFPSGKNRESTRARPRARTPGGNRPAESREAGSSALHKHSPGRRRSGERAERCVESLAQRA